MNCHLTTRNVWLVRHGNRLDYVNPDWSATAERPFDSPLSPDGHVQARDVGRRLAGESIRHIFSSPFLRAVETASAIAQHLELPVRVEAGLCEFFNKDWFPTRPVLLPTNVLSQRFPLIDPGYDSFVMPEYPESETQMRARTARTIHHLLDRFDGDLLLVAHGASVIGFAHALVEGEPPIATLLACLVHVQRTNGEWKLLRNGSDTSHLTISDTSIRLA